MSQTAIFRDNVGKSVLTVLCLLVLVITGILVFVVLEPWLAILAIVLAIILALGILKVWNPSVFESLDKKVVRKPSFVICILCIPLYSLLCSIHADIITSHDNNILEFPLRVLRQNWRQDPQRVQLSKPSSESDSTLYVFVLDVSGSTKNREVQDISWYLDTVGELRDRAEGLKVEELKLDSLKSQLSDLREEKPTGMDIAKLRLYDLLFDLCESFRYKDARTSTPLFAVWTVGNLGEQVFPDSIYAPINDTNLVDAILRIEERQEFENNTNFTDLFRAFLEDTTYARFLQYQNATEQGNPWFILTALSDLLHDVNIESNEYREIDRRREISANWADLESEIQKFVAAKTISNLIVFSEKDRLEKAESIISIIERNVEWYRLNSSLVHEEGSEYLSAVSLLDQIVQFEYESPYRIEKASSILCLDELVRTDTARIRVDILHEISRIPDSRIRIDLAEESTESAQENVAEGENWIGYVISGGNSLSIDLDGQTCFTLVHDGRPPVTLSAPLLRIAVENDYKTFLVPIYFLKTLPVGVAWWMLTVLSVAIASLLFILWNAFLRRVWDWMKNQVGKKKEDKKKKQIGEKIEDNNQPPPRKSLVRAGIEFVFLKATAEFLKFVSRGQRKQKGEPL